MTELEKEKIKLAETVKIVDKNIQEEQEKLDKLYKDFIGDKEELWRIATEKELHIKNLTISKERPYFARIDFTPDSNQKKESIYIGKNGIVDNSKIVVTDWRAPISSLYYDFELGKCNYEAPMGNITGKISLKRQYEIEKGKLIEYMDVDLVSNDQLLQKYLKSNNDARLKSIVATIQKEQNEVIRKRLFDNLIIQGVAGSGKTTVALHRIAYLAYNYKEHIKQNQYLVIGPNPVFLKYIQMTLPELDVSGIEQCTFEQLAKNYIKEEITINSSEKKVKQNISGKIDNNVDKLKCSMKYKEMLDNFLKIFMLSLTSTDLKVGEFKVLDKETINQIFSSIDEKYSPNLKSKIEYAINNICKIIENNSEQIL